jgi:hypothetical protein
MFARSFSGVRLTILVFLYRVSPSLSQVWGVTIGSAVLQNELSSRLPSKFLSSFPGGVAIIYSAIPNISSLDPDTQREVRQAFADSLKTLWEVLLGIAFMGALSSLMMKGLTLHRFMDEKWAMKETPTTQGDLEEGPGEDHGVV